MVKILLSRIDVDTIPALNAKSAVQILREPPLPDMILLDLMLPEISGMDFLRQMREKDVFDNLPVVVMSAVIDPDQIREALDAGADRYLTKPYIANNLVTITTETLRTGRRRPPSDGD